MAKKKDVAANVSETEETGVIATTEIVEDAPSTKDYDELKEYVVTDCQRLNVRSDPDMKGKVKFIITKGTRVNVYVNRKYADWYEVEVALYGHGYAMKQFLTPIIEAELVNM